MSQLADRRRILGPTDAVPLTYEVILNKKDNSTNSSNKPKPTSKTKRIFIKNGTIKDASGSCYIEINDTKLSVAVYGPRSIKGSLFRQFSENEGNSSGSSGAMFFSPTAFFRVKAKYLPFAKLPQKEKLNPTNNHSEINEHGNSSILISNSTTSTSIAVKGSMDPSAREIAEFVETSIGPSIRLSKYPKSSIYVNIEIISSGVSGKERIGNNGISGISSSSLGVTTATAITATSIALVDAGIELSDIVTGVSCRLPKNSPSLQKLLKQGSSNNSNKPLFKSINDMENSINNIDEKDILIDVDSWSLPGDRELVIAYCASLKELTGYYYTGNNDISLQNFSQLPSDFNNELKNESEIMDVDNNDDDNKLADDSNKKLDVSAPSFDIEDMITKKMTDVCVKAAVDARLFVNQFLLDYLQNEYENSTKESF